MNGLKKVLRRQFGRLAALELFESLATLLNHRFHTNSNSTRLFLLLFVVSLDGLADLFNTSAKPFRHRLLHSLIKSFKPFLI
jgi:hypothetical protein